MKKRWLRSVIFCTVVMFSSGLMFGCSSSDDDDDPAPGFIGTAIDGPLAKANVYVDLNGNGAQDTGEPFTMSDEDGNFELEGFNLVEGATIIVESNENTVDISTGKPFIGKLKSKAPAPTAARLNTAFITPLTTLVVEALKKNPAKTEKEILTAMGLGDFTGEIFNYNPLKETVNPDPAKAAQALKYNKVQAKIVAMANIAAAAVTGAGTGLNQEDMFASALEAIGDELTKGNIDLTTDAGIKALNNKIIDATVTAAKKKDTAFDTAKTEAVKASSGSLVVSFAAEIDKKTDLAGLAKVNGASSEMVKTVNNAAKGGDNTSINNAVTGLEANINGQKINPDKLINKDPKPKPGETGSTGGTTN